MAVAFMLPMPVALDADLADDAVPSDEDTPVSLSMTVCMNVVLLTDSGLHKGIFTFIHEKLCTTARGRSSTTTPSTLAPQPACPPAPAKRARARPCPRPRPHPHPSLARWPWAAAARRRPALAPRRHARAAHACSLDARYGPGPVGEARRPAPVDWLHPPG